MADDHNQDAEAAAASPDEALDDEASMVAAPPTGAWANLWQVPAIILSGILIAVGILVVVARAPENDFDGALDQIEAMIDGGEFDRAAAELNEVIEPNLKLASPPQQARFHAIVGDWIALSVAQQNVNAPTHHERVAKEYARAIEGGALMSPARLERWANALIALGQIDSARHRLAELEGLAAASDRGVEIRERRNRVLRRLVEFSLGQEDLSYDVLMDLLDQYAADALLTMSDRLWVIARRAELRLEDGLVREAVDRLLLDMRRIEPELTDADRHDAASLYTLLARAYFDLGEISLAEFQLLEAMRRFRGPEADRGEAILLSGHISTARGEWREGFERYDEAIREYPGTRSHLPALLGRAEVRSVLGEHEFSLADYRTLQELLPVAAPRRDVTPTTVAESLASRHLAALTMRRLETALAYILLAEDFFEPADVPSNVLLGIAMTSRQLADDLMADVTARSQDAGMAIDEAEPAVRHRAAELYRDAGDYYVRHARLSAGGLHEDDAWADSLWLAADSYDLGGWRALALRHFTEYLGGRSDADPRRPEATFRLAQCYQAELEYQDAVSYYEQVIETHPRSPFATSAHVPLARCYRALDRPREAEQQLTLVLEGIGSTIGPDALDYRDALIELGTLLHDTGEYVRAIEQLHKATQRYVGDPRVHEITFRLADSYRRYAAQIGDQLKDASLAPAQLAELEALRFEQLTRALGLFAQVCERDDILQPPPIDRVERQLLRHAYLYRADSAFELGLYDEAVDYYDEVAHRFPGDYASLTALVQIVNCYWALGDENRARAAHNRALVRLKQLPESAFETPDSLLDRSAWEQWLRNIPLGRTVAIAGQ